jgi:cation diffusion facilitator family transporter
MTLFHHRMPEAALDGDHEKQHVAKTSVFAAFALVSMKVVVGLMTGSLGILAEAAHSALDMVAAGVTWFAVHASAKPADREHRYGHGKVENLSALFETVLLLITCVWIGHEAIKRIMSGKVDVEVTFWSFAVMGISIIVDISRSRMLYRAAKKYNSQALEADALHFSTDIWSSAVVILGLLCVALSGFVPNGDWLHYADAVAALVVGLIVIQISWKLGMRTVAALLDAAPEGMEEKVIAAAEKVPGVFNCHHVRVRSSGPQVFVDLHVLVDGSLSLHEAHDLTEAIEKAVEAVCPDADVTVHPEPK